MNGRREPYTVICELPQVICLRFGKSGPPQGTAKFRVLGAEKYLASLPVVECNKFEIKVQLPESLVCHGEGRYEIVVLDECCHVCDTHEVWFEADCEIESAMVVEKESICV